MIPHRLTRMGELTGRVWRSVATLEPYKLLIIGTVKAEDEFIIRTVCYTGSSQLKGLFSHCGCGSFSTVYGTLPNISWIWRQSGGTMLLGGNGDSAPYDLTYTCAKSYIRVRISTGKTERVNGEAAAISLMDSVSGLDMSCLIIGACFGRDCACTLYDEPPLYFSSFIIQTQKHTLDIRQDVSGDFYDNATGRKLIVLDSRALSLVYKA